jgi:uncharacterized protein (TIGR03663 family)
VSQRERWFGVALLAFVGLGLALRLLGLAEKPLHYDEGVNGWFSLRLYWWNLYHYDPSDYHGPFLYYANLVCFWLLGPSEVSLRLAGALSGGLLPLLLLPARRFVGMAGVVVAGLLLAVAPGLVYFSRTGIHEIHLVFFTVLWAVALVRFAAEPGTRWAAWAAGAAAGCFVTKETALLTAGGLACGAGLAWIAGERRPAGAESGEPDLFGGRSRREALVAWTSGSWRAWALGGLLFAGLIAVFYSSFFSHRSGVPAFFEAYVPWVEYGTTGRNQSRPVGYYWSVMASSAGPARWLLLPAAALAVVRRQRLGLALVGWAGSVLLVYSLIPYKTPWCVLQIDLPVFLLIGWAAGAAWRHACDAPQTRATRALALAFLLACVAPAPRLLAWSLEDIGEGYDDFRRPYVYHQTFREFHEMVQDLLGVADADPRGEGRGPRVVNVGLEFPLRWYTLTGGWEDDRTRYLEETPTREQVARAEIVIADHRRGPEIDRLVADAGGEWHQERYIHRPGIYALVWYRRELWQRYQAAGGRTASPWPRPPAERLPPPSAAPR